jgi:hypothetical protein
LVKVHHISVFVWSDDAFPVVVELAAPNSLMAVGKELVLAIVGFCPLIFFLQGKLMDDFARQNLIVLVEVHNSE